MNGSVKLTNEEKHEMLEDAKNVTRGKLFQAMRITTQLSNIDDYIEFLSQNIESVPVVATKRITVNNKL